MNKSSSSRFVLSILGSASSRMRMSTKPKRTSHYDTLEVNSRATQSEIKSAYFKLSKQYHPDKNKSEEASQKFRNITEAYEVLGNFNNRKIYDRTLIVKPRYERESRQSSAVDPKMKYYQTQAAVFQHENKSGATPTYDFDEWTRAHYGRTLRRKVLEKEEAVRLRELREHFQSVPYEKSPEQSFLVVSLLLIVILVVFNTSRTHSDRVYVREQEGEKSRDKNTTRESEVTSNSVSSS